MRHIREHECNPVSGVETEASESGSQPVRGILEGRVRQRVVPEDHSRVIRMLCCGLFEKLIQIIQKNFSWIFQDMRFFSL